MTRPWWEWLKSITLHVEGDPPPMWPSGASEEYRAARRALAEAELALRDQVEAVAAQRRTLPPGPVLPEYRLTEGPPDPTSTGPSTTVGLAELFGEHRELVVYHLMFHPDDNAACAMCSMWVDGLDGVAYHLTRRVGLAVIAKAPIEKLRAWGRTRGWRRVRLVSAYDSPFNTDLGIDGCQGGQFPAVSVFVKDVVDGAQVVRHAYTQSAHLIDGGGRGIDLFSPVWNALDLVPSGRGDWMPELVDRDGEPVSASVQQ
jgi:predicted dithiol-disulfide oxidoreductase (DUF899 family)